MATSDEASAVLSREEKWSVFHHLGYMSQQTVLTIGLGVPVMTQPMFLVAGAIERIPVASVGRIRRTIAILEQIEVALTGVVPQLLVDEIGGIKVRADAGDAIEHEYARWQQRLSNDLGVPINPMSERYAATGRRSMSRPVVHS